ncbi:MAG: hypothetical protein PWR01_109 [Clostridiales bacterium]|nr:hypothetical protein [Clostridiales bacterium]
MIKVKFKFKKGLSDRLSIKWKIFVYLLGFCALLLVLLWLFQVVFLDSFYRAIRVNETKKSAQYILENLNKDNKDNLKELIERTASENDVSIELVVKDGRIIYVAGIIKDSILPVMSVYDKVNLIQQAKQNGGEFLGYYSIDIFRDRDRRYNIRDLLRKPPVPARSPMNTILYLKVAKDSTGQDIVIFINSMISPVDATVKTLRIQLYCVTGFMILFSIVLAFAIAKKVSDPIQKINDAAKILASGKYDVSFKSSGYREIKELSDTLNFTARELSKVEKLRRELIANVSHDLRTPLTLIAGYAEAMRDLPNENTPENAQIIIDEAMRLTTLVNDLLNLSKIQSGAQTLNISEFNLTQLLRQMINRTSELVKKEGYVIQFIYDDEVYVMADETLISQAFYNLLINAINYTGEDKKVVVKQTINRDEVKVEVTDTGEGIAPEDLPYVWDRYYKVDKNHKRAVTGTGIGLSIVKSIMEMHGTKYGVVSKVNEGSTFWFSLKRCK